MNIVWPFWDMTEVNKEVNFNCVSQLHFYFAFATTQLAILCTQIAYDQMKIRRIKYLDCFLDAGKDVLA